ncbi:hypothetical protein [Longimicrobium terrae]|uniref:Uncharacterized protein n=1 Tax=Longimicrobium terrae TaxID=1639882 RepID=A0A841GNC7_9BACT|nr:hypothetical protein [Longimicrobium terrae]MBB4634288.1 hypothetical protein [Longimicrobium terrae]MBB6068822.1 hypothetical protein [Longimicrobium terrae]NNC28005.1 hypothetical protein [Longimicrobium terrae]
MINPSRTLSVSARLAAMAGVFLLAGCAAIQPPPVPAVPRVPFLGERPSFGEGGCNAYVVQAHAAWASAGVASDDPAVIAAAQAAANAAAAAAMAAYHDCVWRSNQP